MRMKFLAHTIGEREQAASSSVDTDIPARLDRLPWSGFHTLVVVALGITWILDGLEVTLAGSVAGALKASPVLQFSNADVGVTASAYLAGAVAGACRPTHGLRRDGDVSHRLSQAVELCEARVGAVPHQASSKLVIYEHGDEDQRLLLRRVVHPALRDAMP